MVFSSEGVSLSGAKKGRDLLLSDLAKIYQAQDQQHAKAQREKIASNSPREITQIASDDKLKAYADSPRKSRNPLHKINWTASSGGLKGSKLEIRSREPV